MLDMLNFSIEQYGIGGTVLIIVAGLIYLSLSPERKEIVKEFFKKVPTIISKVKRWKG